MIVYGLAGGLNQKYIRSADSFFQRNRGFAIGKGFYYALTNGQAEFLADGFRECGIGITTENFDFTVRNHLSNTSLFSISGSGCVPMPRHPYYNTNVK